MWTGFVLQNRQRLLAGEDMKSRRKVWLSTRDLQTSLGDIPCLLRLRWCDHLPDRYNLRQARWIWAHVFREILVHPGRGGMAKWRQPEKAERMVEACSHASGPGNRDHVVPLENLTSQCLSLVIYSASQAFPAKGSTADKRVPGSWRTDCPHDEIVGGAIPEANHSTHAGLTAAMEM